MKSDVNTLIAIKIVECFPGINKKHVDLKIFEYLELHVSLIVLKLLFIFIFIF